jgi:hypothetical protein
MANLNIFILKNGEIVLKIHKFLLFFFFPPISEKIHQVVKFHYAEKITLVTIDLNLGYNDNFRVFYLELIY